MKISLQSSEEIHILSVSISSDDWWEINADQLTSKLCIKLSLEHSTTYNSRTHLNCINNLDYNNKLIPCFTLAHNQCCTVHVLTSDMLLDTHCSWMHWGSVGYEVCPVLLHMTSTRNRTLGLIILVSVVFIPTFLLFLHLYTIHAPCMC